MRGDENSLLEFYEYSTVTPRSGQSERDLLRTCVCTHEKEGDYMSAMIAPEVTAQVGGGEARLRGPRNSMCGWTVFCNYEQLGEFLGSDARGLSFPSESRQ